MKSKIISTHQFIFPFVWEKGDKKELYTNLTQIRNVIRGNDIWIKVNFEETKSNLNYNIKQAFYPFVHEAILQQKSSALNILSHYEYKELCNKKDVFYCIELKNDKKSNDGKIYKLNISQIHINLYATGIGLLSIYTNNCNKDQSEPEDILNINQFGSHIIPKFHDDFEKRSEIGSKISIKGLKDSALYESFDKNESKNQSNTHDTWQTANFIEKLIQSLDSKLIIHPIVSDRMFVICSYCNQKYAEQIKDINLEDSYKNEYSKFWYKFLFLNSAAPEALDCQNDKMMNTLLTNHTYFRWQESNTLYGFSDSSLVLLTDNTPRDFLTINLNSIYTKLAELVLVQKTSILCFLQEIQNLNDIGKKHKVTTSLKANSIYESYLLFISQINFENISYDKQINEIYKGIRNSMEIQNYENDLSIKIQELYQYISLVDNRIQDKKSGTLNRLAAIFLPVSIVIGFFGMNQFSEIFNDAGLIKEISLVISSFIIGMFIDFLISRD